MEDDQQPAARRRRLGTVRAKLTVLATVIVVLVLGVSALFLILVQQRLLTGGIDQSLIQRADNIESDVANGTFGAQLPGEGDPEDRFTQVIGEDGELVAASANAEGLAPASDPADLGAGDELRSITGIRNSEHFRILVRGVETDTGLVTLVVAQNLDDVNESVRILSLSLAVAVPVATLLLAGLVWWLTGRVLRPVEAIRAEVARIHGAELHRRVPVSGSHDEISRLAHTMNGMLARVEKATEQQQRFVADASHELRGPLTRIHSALDIAIAHPDAVEEDELRQGILSDIDELNHLVDDLLFLARSESGALDPLTEVVDLDDLVLAEARRLRDRGSVRVQAGSVTAARSVGDSRQLTRAIRNLASNAERHAASTVSFELQENDSSCQLVVADDGAGIPAEHHETVFKRFARLDEARSRDSGGSGLGLAIVHDIVSRHGGTIEIAQQNGGGARFVVTLPRAD
ncbi:MAG TPA: ATP-binding protein [Nocardioidaceae bacterium]|nr:ATP-binding protein [Nocardioidaceae bacterium]